MISDIINKHLPKAFSNELNDAVKPFTGSRVGERGSYDPITDTYTQGSNIEYVGRGVFGSYLKEETADTQINLTDTKLTCLQIEVNEVPKIDDVIKQGDNEYRVLSVRPDPTDSIWTVQLRGLDDVTN